jgi:hypothetical protein
MRFLTALVVFCLSLSVFGQDLATAEGLAAMSGTNVASGGGGGSQWIYMTNLTASATVGGSATIPAFDATGAQLIVVQFANYTGFPGVSDSTGANTYTNLTKYTDASATYSQGAWYIFNPNTSTTMTVSGASSYTKIDVWFYRLSGGHTPVFDKQNGLNAHPALQSDTSWQTGSITPAADDALIFAGTVFNNAATASINSSFTKLTQGQETSDALYSASAVLVQTTVAAVNPTWTVSAPSTALAANIFDFTWQ